MGVSEKEIDHIIGDMDNIEEAGEAAKYEKDNMCTVVTKLYKKDGTVHFAQATRTVDLKKDINTGLRYYPVAHFVWEETAMRRAITVKNTAYPQKIANMDKIANPSAVGQVGGIVKVKGGAAIDDVAKILANLNPAQMSSDVEKLQNELIATTRELAGAGDIATGDINPESASGRAILAVQQASQQPLTEHLQYLKAFVEDLARIWLDMLIVYNNSIILYEEVTDPGTGKEDINVKEVSKTSLEELKASVKVDITPKGAFDRYAQEQSMENLLTSGLCNA